MSAADHDQLSTRSGTGHRQHDEPGTLSVRHLKRLAAGKDTSGKPIGPPRQATVRLLERIFGTSIDELLSEPDGAIDREDAEAELRARLRASARIDAGTLTLLHEQLAATRRLDRELGAPIAHGEVLAKIEQVDQLMRYSLTPAYRQCLGEHLSELCALAGWQALDMGSQTEAW